MRIAVVGPCASGKSTLVDHLRAAGYDAWSVAQEHSMIADLWRHQEPDVLVALDVSLTQLRERRENPVWPAWLYAAQQQRLSNAFDHADVRIDTDELAAEDVVAVTLSHLSDESSA